MLLRASTRPQSTSWIPPKIDSRFSVSPSRLGPPNDKGDGNTAFDIVFDGQPVFSQGTGVRAVPMVGNQARLSLQLQAERSGRGSGRIYTISCHAVDAAGNAGQSRSVAVTVPR